MQAKNLTTVAIQAGATPFAEGFEVVGMTFGAVNILGSDDGVTYTALLTGVASELLSASFVMPAYIKASAAGGAVLLGGP